VFNLKQAQQLKDSPVLNDTNVFSLVLVNQLSHNGVVVGLRYYSEDTKTYFDVREQSLKVTEYISNFNIIAPVAELILAPNGTSLVTEQEYRENWVVTEITDTSTLDKVLNCYG
jgi:hypothetical protein